MTPVNFQEHLRLLMSERQLTQKKLAAELGVSQATVFKWLNGSIPLGDSLTKLADYLGLNPDYILNPEKYRSPLKEYAAAMKAAKTPEETKAAEAKLKERTATLSEANALRERAEKAEQKLARMTELLEKLIREIKE